jgi:methyl-accepting chemotaxis protein
MTRPYRRHKYLIKKGFQLRFIVRFLVVSLLGSVFAVGFFNFLAYRKMDILLFSMKIPAVNPGNALLKEAVYANGISLVLIVFVYLLAAKGIHAKMAGSLHRIRADIHGLVRGDLGTRVLLTEDEEFRDLAEELNLMAGELQRRFSDIKERFDRIDESMKDLKGIPEEDGKVLEGRVLPQLAALEERLGEFKI